MFYNNGMNGCQSKTTSLLFGGKIRIEYFVEILRHNPHALVLYHDPNIPGTGNFAIFSRYGNSPPERHRLLGNIIDPQFPGPMVKFPGGRVDQFLPMLQAKLCFHSFPPGFPAVSQYLPIHQLSPAPPRTVLALFTHTAPHEHTSLSSKPKKINGKK